MQSIVSIFSSSSIVRRPFLWFLWPNYILPSFNFPAPLSSSSNQDAVISADFPHPSLFYLLPSPFFLKSKENECPCKQETKSQSFYDYLYQNKRTATAAGHFVSSKQKGQRGLFTSRGGGRAAKRLIVAVLVVWQQIIFLLAV